MTKYVVVLMTVRRSAFLVDILKEGICMMSET